MPAEKRTKSARRTREALLYLLRAGLWEHPAGRCDSFPLSPEEWDDVWHLATQQTVTGLVFHGMQFVAGSCLPDPPRLMRWAAAADAVERRNDAMNRALASLYGTLRSAGLNPILQKGQAVAAYYAVPALRECGDIDLYFDNVRTWNTALRAISSFGICAKHEGDGSVAYVWEGVPVEHHRQLLDLHAPASRRYGMALQRCHAFDFWSLPSKPDLKMTVPSPVITLHMLSLHVLKHAFGLGIGLRQLCDMARACHVMRGQVDPEAFAAQCRQLGLARWQPLLHAFLVEQLGLPAASLPYAEVAPSAAPLSDIVWAGGNFGKHGPGGVATGWRRKLATATAYVRRAPFALRYAPREAFWSFARLLAGQVG